jgi:hypothetical protein
MNTSEHRETVRRLVMAAVSTLSVLGLLVFVAWSEGWLGGGSHDPYKSIASSKCRPAVLPVGQADPSGEPEPLWPTWCYRLAKMPITRISGSNTWLDEFNVGIDMGLLNDGDMDYRVFGDIDHSGQRQSLAFINQNHWMVDTAGGNNGGLLVRPNRAFRFENGKLVVEADVAAAIPEYEDSASVEIDISTAPEPTGKVVDLQYGYGLFGGHWTFGCRFQADRQIICALFNAAGSPGEGSVFGNELGRVWQMLPFQHVGTVNFGGEPLGERAQYFRQCASNEMDFFCRDRFRLELAKDSVKVFVNGKLYFEQSGFEPQHQLPDEFLNSDLYIYFTNWINRPLEVAYRFHWDRLAVNAKDANGAPIPPLPSPSFGQTVPHH